MQAKAQQINYQWANGLFGNGIKSMKSVKTDSESNVIVCGSFTGSSDFDPGPMDDTRASNGSHDIFVEKFDVLGNLVWIHTLGGTGEDIGHSLSIDNDDNIYIAGQFAQTVDFDPGSLSADETSAGGLDAFIVKLSPGGQLIWVQTFGGPFSDLASSIMLGNSNEVIVAGEFRMTVDFDPNSGVVNKTGQGGSDYFIQSLDDDGNLQWVQTFGGIWDEKEIIVTTDILDNIIVGGKFTGTVNFGNLLAPINLSSYSSNTTNDAFVQKLSPQGIVLWAKHFGGTGGDCLGALDCDSQGNIYASGEFEGTADFDTGTNLPMFSSNGFNDIFVLKMNAQGESVWSKSIGGIGFDWGSALTIDNIFGGIYLTGSFGFDVDFDPGLDTLIKNHGSSPGQAIFLLKLTENGEFGWVESIKSSNAGFGQELALDSEGNIIIAGEMIDTVDFDPSLDTANIGAPLGLSLYIAKYELLALGIPNLPKTDSKIKAYPNPTKGELNVELKNVYPASKLELLDITGRTLQTKTVQATGKETLNLQSFARGVYLVRITSGSDQWTSKIIKK